MRQRHECDVQWHDQFSRAMPARLIEQDDRLRPGRDMEGDLLEMHAHRLAVAPGHVDAGSLAFSRTECSKDPYRGPPLFPRR